MSDPADFDGLLLDADLPPGHRSGFVAVIGQPNVGKSTLMNRLLGEKLAIVSPRPQTTRENQLGILTTDAMQVVFVDTPGIHDARNALGDVMVKRASSTIPDANVILFIVDVSSPPDETDHEIAAMINRRSDVPVILVQNKRDLLDSGSSSTAAYEGLVPRADTILISAEFDTDFDQLIELIREYLPEGPRYYPSDQLTETQLRDNAAEVIREQIMLHFEKEIPYSVAVQVEEFKERAEDMTYIRAVVYVERESQKGIVIGKGGEMLKTVSQAARHELEELLGTRVYLELWVKVLKNWRKDEQALRRLGYL